MKSEAACLFLTMYYVMPLSIFYDTPPQTCLSTSMILITCQFILSINSRCSVNSTKPQCILLKARSSAHCSIITHTPPSSLFIIFGRLPKSDVMYGQGINVIKKLRAFH